MALGERADALFSNMPRWSRCPGSVYIGSGALSDGEQCVHNGGAGWAPAPSRHIAEQRISALSESHGLGHLDYACTVTWRKCEPHERCFRRSRLLSPDALCCIYSIVQAPSAAPNALAMRSLT
eukprot:TRINITY_DN1737_c0_g1_i1.p1 TRINITY_DN1737_c0_g1~~TRINITY_DN1737_c0_g1_i1.p1  ORF type:complete len:131 (+),score=6.72 TRINITY_DN1737_c0_g1_i1:27-395(+)